VILTGDGRALDSSAVDALRRYSQLAYLLDRAFSVPGTRLRFGIDPLIGLFPGIGDAITSILGAYGLWVARQLGAPVSIQMRMLTNLLLDAAIGAIPLLGDLFDFAFKSNTRNLALLEAWLNQPRKVQRGSIVLLAGSLLVLFAVVFGALWLLVMGIHALVS
jgi:hypothetical protein